MCMSVTCCYIYWKVVVGPGAQYTVVGPGAQYIITKHSCGVFSASYYRVDRVM
jgi:hypothetical protein